MKPILILSVYCLLLLGCTVDNTNETQLRLPNATQIGANTFGCYIDGKLLVPRDGTGSILGPDSGASFLGGYPDGAYNELDIRDYKSSRTASILIHIHDLRQLGEGNYVVDESNGARGIDGLDHTYIHCRIFNEALGKYQYYRSFDNSGTIEITRFDWSNGIVSGLFSCRVINSTNSDDIIEITEGRFDINGYTLPNKVFP